MRNKNYTCKILTKPEDMQCTYELALLLNPRITKDDYQLTINNACQASNSYSSFNPEILR